MNAKYPRPFVRKGTGPMTFFSANALNRDYGTKLPDFVFYNQACNSTKKLIHTKHGYESVFYAANSYQIKLVLDKTNRFSPEVENFLNREDTLEKLLNLKYAWPHVGVHPRLLDHYVRNPIYERRKINLYRSISSGEFEAVAKLNNLIPTLTDSAGTNETASFSIRGYPEFSIAHDNYRRFGLFEVFASTGFADVDDAMMKYASEYIHRTTNLEVHANFRFDRCKRNY